MTANATANKTTSAIHIRPAQAQDQKTIRKLVWDARLDPTTIHWQNFIVAEDHQPMPRIIGIAQIRPYRDCREFGSLMVLPDYRRLGIGRQLVETLLAQETGDVYLDCVRAKVPYYSRFGFRVIPFNERPFTLKLKSLGSLLLRPFGIQVVTMKRAPR